MSAEVGRGLPVNDTPVYGTDTDYLIWASLSSASCLAMMFFYLASPDTRKLPGTFILFRSLCELAFSISLILQKVNWLTCDNSAAINQVAQTASNLWIVVMSFDLVLKVKNPFDVRTFRTRYHSFVWITSAVPAVISSLAGMVGENRLGFCWLKPEIEHNDYRSNDYRWGLVYVPCLLCLLATCVMMTLVSSKLKYGLQLSHTERRRVISHGRKYVRGFVVYWVLLGGIYLSAALVDPQEGSFYLHFLQHAFPLLIAGHGVLLFGIWLWVNHAKLETTPPSFAAAFVPAQNEEAWISKSITEQLRRELVHLTAIGIFHGASHTNSTRVWEGIFHSCNVVSENPTGCCGLPLLELKIEAMRGFELQSDCTFYDYAPKHFHILRERLGVDSEDYMQAFLDWEDGCEGLRERFSEGASRSFLYFTQDRRFVVKTVERTELEALVQMLPALTEHVSEHGETLIHYYGAHAVRLPLYTSRIFFVVMKNIFNVPGVMQIRRLPTEDGLEQALMPTSSLTTFDLKGALFRRRAAPDAKCRLDLDWLDIKSSALSRAPIAARERIAQCLQHDAQLLERFQMLDYSLLLGVRECCGPPPADIAGSNLIVSGDTVYCFGIVDALDGYSCGWWWQGVCLGTALRFACKDQSSITAVPPTAYAQRFVNFIHRRVLFLEHQQLPETDFKVPLLHEDEKGEASDQPSVCCYDHEVSNTDPRELPSSREQSSNSVALTRAITCPSVISK